MRRLGLILAGTAMALVLAGANACSSDDDNGSSGSSGSSGTTSGGPADASGTDGTTPSDGASPSDASAADGATDAGADADTGVAPGTFTLTSTAYAEGANIPAVHTCDGTNVSPPLTWTNAPAGTQSYAVVMRDLSLGNNPNYHWVIYDIPASTTALAQGIEKAASPAVPAGAKQTNWSFGNSVGYSGPCPPSGVHDYQLTVYSFATPTIAVPGGTTAPAAADTVIQAAKTGSATLNGKYQR